MTIEIHQTEIEELIQQRLQSGAFQNIEDVLLHALKTSEMPGKASSVPTQVTDDHDGFSVAERRKRAGRKSLPEIFKPIRGILNDEEVDTLFARNRLPSRPIDLS